VRGRLREFANQHPSDSVRELAGELAEGVDRAYVSTQWFFEIRDRGHDAMPVAYEAADKHQQEAVELSERLMTEIRRRRPRWLP